MLTKEELELLDYTEDIRELYLSEGSITFNDGMFFIQSQSVLMEIISAFLVVDFKYIGKLYSYIQDEADRLYYEFVYKTLNGEDALSVLKRLREVDALGKYKSETSLYYAIMKERKCNDYSTLFNSESIKIFEEKMLKYINMREYTMALEFVKAMGKRINHYIIDVISALLSKKEDKIVYILEKGIYPSDITNDNLHRIEREALVTLETGDIIDFYDDMEVLEILYENQDPLPLLNINTLVSALLLFEAEETYVSHRSFSTFMGPFSSTLFELLRANDYYRVDELIKETKADSSEFNIYLEILDIISSKIMFYNRQNMKNVRKIVSSMNTGEISLGEFISEYPLSSISRETLKEHEENEFLSNDDRKNYYELYRVCFKDGEYKEALKALMKLEKKGKVIGYHINVDYLVKELKIYIANYLENEENAQKADKAIREGNAYFNEGNYIKAILQYDKALSLMPYHVPKIVAQIGACYFKLNDYEKALESFKTAPLDGLYPEDLLMMLESMFYAKQYHKMPAVMERLESISPKCNVRIYYLMSIAYVKMRKYNAARDMLGVASELNYDYHNAVTNFEEEKRIILRAEKEKSDVCYSMDDFVDLEMSEEEIDLSDDLDKYRYEYEEGFIDAILEEIKNSKGTAKEKIIYLLSIIKILKVQGEDVSTKGIYDYLNELMRDSNISSSEQKQFTLAMKNYKKI